MKADSLTILDVFSSGGNILYFLPHFQRHYAWSKAQWTTLLHDVLSIYEIYDPEQPPEHFMGSLVVVSDGNRGGVIAAFKLVDGQQRLTTISLFLCAVMRLLKDSHTETAGDIERLLLNVGRPPELRYKLTPTTKYGDQLAYRAILNNDPVPTTESSIPLAYNYYYSELRQRALTDHIDLQKLFLVLVNSLQVVFINLNVQEQPYKIFESLNAKGMPLSQADLVRNYIAMKLPNDKQEVVFEQHWSKIEGLLHEKRRVARLPEISAFIRHYLASFTGLLCNEEHVYARFRDRIERECKSQEAFVAEIVQLERFATYYDRLLRPEHEPNLDIRRALERLSILDVSTAYPFLLAAYNALENVQIGVADFLGTLELIENYLVRRHLTGEPPSYPTRMFGSLWSEIDKDHYLASLRDVLVTKNYPGDNQIQQAVYSQRLYGKNSQSQGKLCLVLESINRHLSADRGGYTVLDGAPTIEHIMPQTLNKVWKEELGDEWSSVYRDYLHTLGNLTLVTQTWNLKLSNGPFKDKKPVLARHELPLNKEYFSQPIRHWNKAAIRSRAEYLLSNILAIWPAIGIPPIPLAPTNQPPKLLTIQGETFVVSNWRKVTTQTAEWVATRSKDFGAVVGQFPNYFSQTKMKSACRQLSNGWWIYVQLSAKESTDFCRRLMVKSGYLESDWHVELREDLAEGVAEGVVDGVPAPL